ncbi:MAG: ABC transporter permease [Clostridia bacterium]
MNFFKDVNRNKALLSMTLPVLVFYALFHYLPMFGMSMAFKSVSISRGIFKSPWNGLSNFKFLFQTQDAWIITRNTIFYNLTFIVLGMLAAMCLAILYDLLGRGKLNRLNQSLSLFPHFISWVVASYFVYAFLSPDKGLLNQFSLALGGSGEIEWYAEKKYWPFILIFCNIWKHIGYDSIIYYSNIKGFDMELYEAARIDGANWFQQIRYITFPMLKSIVIVLGILKVGSIFYSDFGLFYLVPKNSGALYSVTSTIDTYVYNGMMSGGNLGMSAAAGFYQSIVGFCLVLLVNTLVRKISPEDAMF